MLRGEVPGAWARAAYPSLKPLASWCSDLRCRVDFIRGWLVAPRPPERFKLPYFFLPQGFLTGVLQMHARKHRTPVDFLSFDFHLLDEPSAETIAAALADSPGTRGPLLRGLLRGPLLRGLLHVPLLRRGLLLRGLLLRGLLRVMRP